MTKADKIRFKSKRRKKRVFAQYRFECLYCSSKDDLTLEHLTPIVKGGTAAMENLAVSCYDCNREKGEMTHEEYCSAYSIPDRRAAILMQMRLDIH